jgi:hypothetical protein
MQLSSSYAILTGIQCIPLLSLLLLKRNSLHFEATSLSIHETESRRSHLSMMLAFEEIIKQRFQVSVIDSASH